jgi:ketosteroid isomerase-like protein
MRNMKTKTVADNIPAYTYGTAEIAKSPISVAELFELKQSAGFTLEDEEHLRMAGDILSGRAAELVETWRGVISKIPHLARHSRGPDGKPIAHYSERSGLRFQQWILDTCYRTYDQNWLNYQHEIALRHTSLKKNKADGVESTAYVPLRDIVAFTAVINDTVKPFLEGNGRSPEDVERMHSAWCKSVMLQIALWAEPYASSPAEASGEWSDSGGVSVIKLLRRTPKELNMEGTNYPEIERIYHEWDRALSKNDTAAILDLYAPDAELESPLVPHLMGGDNGVIRGREELRKFFDVVANRKPGIRQFYRTGYFTDGRKVMWEYPHFTPQGEQMDFVEVMEIQNGKIQKHRVYWGWFGFNVIRSDRYHR